MKEYHPPRTFIYSEAMASQAQIDESIQRLKNWADNQAVAYIQSRLQSHQNFLDEYERTGFKGRYKANITIFHERAKVTLLKIIHDKSKGKRASRGDRDVMGGTELREVSQAIGSQR